MLSGQLGSKGWLRPGLVSAWLLGHTPIHTGTSSLRQRPTKESTEGKTQTRHKMTRKPAGYGTAGSFRRSKHELRIRSYDHPNNASMAQWKKNMALALKVWKQAKCTIGVLK